MDIGLFYREYKRHLDKARAAQQSGDYPLAREEYLHSAKLLFTIAGKTEGDLRATRVANARKLIAIAEQFKDRAREKRATRVATAAADGRAAKPGARRKTPDDRAADSEDPHLAPVDGLDAPLPDDAREAAEVGAETDRFLVAERPSTRFDDIKGLDDAKREINLRMILPLTHPERAKAYGIRLGGGVLLYGPPGTGKTMMAKAVAGEIEAAFYTVTPADLLSKYVGESEQNLEALFESARKNEISVVFIDEIEAMIPRRDAMQQSPVMQRVVPQLLAELDGVSGEKKNPLLFVGATNEPWALDPAVLRPGRFDAKIYIGLPSPAARAEIVAAQVKDRPLADDVSIDALVAKLDGFSGADCVGLCRRVAADVFMRAIEADRDLPIAMADFERALTTMHPSVTAAMLEKFQNFSSGKSPHG